ncbi:MAG: hypothetical protein DRP01_04830 [Archaeoglobales archaeon]|nr:MAG: hypothetical protein DRP01_04830 [Archaeoglobales archaeon]
MRMLMIILLISNANALTIVTTFPSLKEDVRMIAVNDTIYSIPAYSHDYELTPRDVEMLKNADLIVSTSHTHFEERISEMKVRGELKGILVEIPKIESMKFLKYPNTERINPHMPIYDPGNYKIFILHLADVLQSLNPSERYVDRAEEVCREVDEIEISLNGTALVDYPFAQYAVNWLGLRVVDVAFNSPTTPGKFKSVDYLVLTKPLSLRSKALMENVEHKAIVYVESPFTNKSIIQKLREIEVVSEETPGYSVIIVLFSIGVVLWLRSGF